MPRPRKLFDEQFPVISQAFSNAYPSAAEYRSAVGEGTAHAIMTIAMMAGDLMTTATSHREASDLFSRYQFGSRRMFLAGEMAKMAGKTQRKQSTNNDKPAWQGFLDLRLTEGQLEELDGWKPKPQEIWDAVDEMTADSYRLTLSYNKNTKLASVTIIDDSPTRKSGGFALSNADTNGALALKMAVFKHKLLLMADWTSLLDLPVKSRRG